MSKPDPVPLLALAGCVLTLVIAVLGAGYDTRASFTSPLSHYLPMAGLVVALAVVFVWYYRRGRPIF